MLTDVVTASIDVDLFPEDYRESMFVPMHAELGYDFEYFEKDQRLRRDRSSDATEVPEGGAIGPQGRSSTRAAKRRSARSLLSS